MADSAVQDLPRRRFTADEYQRMGQVGILGEDDRVELLDGQVVATTPIGPGHAGVVNRLTRLFVLAVGDGAIVGVQNPVRLSAVSEPEPDLALLRPRADDYTTSHPGPDDVILLVEVADTSMAVDRGVKVPLYAEAGVAEVWVVDLADDRVIVHSAPADGAYTSVHTVGPGQVVSPSGVPDAAISVDEVLTR